MKNFVKISTTFLIIIFVISSQHISAQQYHDSLPFFKIDYFESSHSEYFRGNAQVTIHHDEIPYNYNDLKKAVKKSKSLTLTTSNRVPSKFFKAGSTLTGVNIKIDGNKLQILDVTIENNKRSGKGNKIKLKYKRVE